MLRKLWIEVRSSLWFVPGLLVLAAIGLALILVEVDVAFAGELRSQRWQPLLNAGAEGARGMLAAIAGSMITVAGVAFSITIVTLSLASTQYTPRILRNFMRDRANQFVLGIFVAVFTFCLLVMRTIRGGSEEDGGGFVPLLSVAVGMLMALVSIGCLIFFIHHIATSIQASTILKSVTAETCVAIENLFPEDLGKGEAEAEADLLEASQWFPVHAESDGYLQHIDAKGLLRFAEKHGLVVRLDCSPGDFVHHHGTLVSCDRELGDEERGTLCALFVVGDFRTVEQDAGFGIRQIVDIGMKALSPGVNDTSTAVSCLDYLSTILSRLARRRIGSAFREEAGKLRVIAPTPRFADFAAKAFNEIRLSAEQNVTIMLQMLCVIQRIAAATGSSARHGCLLQHAALVAELADRSVTAPYDRERLNHRLSEVRAAVGANITTLPPLPSATSPKAITSAACD